MTMPRPKRLYVQSTNIAKVESRGKSHLTMPRPKRLYVQSTNIMKDFQKPFKNNVKIKNDI